MVTKYAQGENVQDTLLQNTFRVLKTPHKLYANVAHTVLITRIKSFS